ncbi:MAG: small nuclear ribonucleoprotein [Candidatus Aenigmarchaeota archaeon]|nr:small nuclear ribonucleoprotein [Candidatus Aenigmarchaeota archaeon]
MAEKRPFDILNASLDNSVLIRLKGGLEVRGKMASYDVHMNLVLEGAEQLENGEVKRKIGTLLLRGDNIVFIAPSL